MNILQCLEIYGLDTTKIIKIARHQDPRLNLEGIKKVYENNELELYQSYQEEDQFNIGDYIISCIGIENNQSLFIGVYEVIGKSNIIGFPTNLNVSFQGKSKINSRYKYDMVRMKEFDEFKDRIVIRNSGRKWCQNAKNNPKEIVQILPKGYVRDFPGYYDFILTYEELKKIVLNEAANKVWHDTLSAVAGVYLIIDKTNGLQYVGSASGKNGIIGRWKEYTKNGHGGNLKLRELLIADPDYAKNFKFTILQTLPKTLTQKEVVQKEKLYKEKLGSRAFGLNCNL